MELHSPVVAKKLWNFLRVAFFMMRKGLISKRKLIMDMNLMMKRGKYLRKSWGKNLIFHHRSSYFKNVQPAFEAGFGSQDYEFSCSSSPNPAFFQAGNTSKRRHAYFPCIGAIVEENDESINLEMPRPVAVLPSIEYSPTPQCSYDLAPGGQVSPLASPFAVRVSNYSSEDEGEGMEDRKVDDEAEEFIRMFYEQLRAQNRFQLLQYQEMQ